MNQNQGNMMRTPFSNQVNQTPQQNITVVQNTTNGAEPPNSALPNTASFCDAGVETVQEIEASFIEILKEARMLQALNSLHGGQQMMLDRRNKFNEKIKMIKHLFRRLKIIYDNVNNECGGMDYTPIETLIPYKEITENKPDIKKASDVYRQSVEEGKSLKESLHARSNHLKEIINHLRKFIWEVNSMSSMKNVSFS